ncbi:MAG: SEC-C domain-containing protein [Kiritimatiellae bacterium]|nr:SEC-C domain-containing protein [Kiritimatiellia bacterium]
MHIDSGILYAPCPCGSGKKFKFCHYGELRDVLPDRPSPSDVTAAVRKAIQPWNMVNDVDPHEDREAIELMRKGIAARDEGRLAEAEALFRSSRSLQPKLYTSWNNEALCLWLSGRFEEAVRRQEEGLERSAGTNAYGWSQLAEWMHFLGRDEDRDRATGRAMAIAPLTAAAAAKTCSALARAKRHADILEYAEKSGFAGDPDVEIFTGLAAANLGDAARGRGIADKDGAGSFDGPVERVAGKLEPGRPESVDPSGHWPYFFVDDYGAGPYLGWAAARRAPEDENVVCDVLEILLADHAVTRSDALEALEPFAGGRAGALRDALGKSDAYEEVDASEWEAYETSGDELAFQKALAGFGVEAVELTEETPPDWGLEDPQEQREFNRLLGVSKTKKPGSPKWTAAREGFLELSRRHPEFFRAAANHAIMLVKEGRIDEGRRELERVAEAHPDYPFARAALVGCALAAGDTEGAGEWVKGYRPPPWMHAEGYLAWLRAALRYWDAVGDEARAQNTADAIERIELEFGL